MLRPLPLGACCILKADHPAFLDTALDKTATLLRRICYRTALNCVGGLRAEGTARSVQKGTAIDSVKSYIHKHTNPPVFFISGAIVLAFLLVGILATDVMSNITSAAMGGIAKYFGWFYILLATFFLIFVVGLLVSRFGKIRLGPDGARPEFGTTAWFAMLFTAGMGIGLVYYGVYEPVFHYGNAPIPESASQTEQAAQGMNYTFFHWGLHPWAIYIVLGLSMAYFAFRKKLPLRPAAAFYPLIGDRIYGWIGNLIDILAVFGTLFGLATSLGLGTKQINAGLTTLFGFPNNVGTQILIIAVISAVAITSVMFGVDKGIRRLSVVNLWLAVAVMVIVFVAGPKLYMLSGLADYIGYYFQNLVGTSFTVFNPNTQPEAASWQAGWTIFYWGWWISWSPFVGMFVARISYGRTIRQFIGGVLFAPVGASFVWFTVFGGSGLFYQLTGQANILDAGKSTAMFVLLQELPLPGVIAGLASVLAILVVTLFFATSSDSGSLVIDMLTNGGDPHPIRAQRLFWATLEGLVTMVLLVVGGKASLDALQAAAVITGLPFSLVLLGMCFALLKGLRQDHLPPVTPDVVPPGKAAPETDHMPERQGARQAPVGGAAMQTSPYEPS